VSVLVVLSSHAKPDRVEDLKALFREILPDTRSFDGCEGVTVYQDQDDPTRIILLETWESRPKFETYGAWRAGRGDSGRMGELVAAPPLFQFHDIVDA